jgi:ribonuclease Z
LIIYFVGTGAGGSPGSRRWRASTLFELKDSIILVDCGVGCHYRLSDKGYLKDIDAVFVTHPHMDHFLGLPELLFQAHMEGRKKHLTIYAPPGVEETIRAAGPHLYTAIDFKFKVKPLVHGLNVSLGGSDSVRVFKACHRIEAYGLRINSEGEASIGYSGDTAEPCEPLLKGFEGVDILIHEATCCNKYEDLCHQYAHSTNYEAVKTAEKVGAKILILNHIDEVFNSDVKEEVSELRKSYSGKLILSEDQDILIF